MPVLAPGAPPLLISWLLSWPTESFMLWISLIIFLFDEQIICSVPRFLSCLLLLLKKKRSPIFTFHEENWLVRFSLSCLVKDLGQVFKNHRRNWFRFSVSTENLNCLLVLCRAYHLFFLSICFLYHTAFDLFWIVYLCPQLPYALWGVLDATLVFWMSLLNWIQNKPRMKNKIPKMHHQPLIHYIY